MQDLTYLIKVKKEFEEKYSITFCSEILWKMDALIA